MKTLEKLNAMCAEHGCEMDDMYDAYWETWRLFFYAPPKMQWNSGTSTCVAYHGSLVSATKWLKEELAGGFSPASYEQLRDTDQLD